MFSLLQFDLNTLHTKMFKLLLALSLFLVIQCRSPILGGYTNRPDLIKSPITQSMVKLAVIELARSENLQVKPIAVISVSSQLVNGINYRIEFTAGTQLSGAILNCVTQIYKPFIGQPSVSSVEC